MLHILDFNNERKRMSVCHLWLCSATDDDVML